MRWSSTPGLFALALAAAMPAHPADSKPFYFFNILPDRFAQYPSCDSPEAQDHICKAGESGEGAARVIFMELRPEKPTYLTSNIWVGVSPEGRPTWFYVRTGGLQAQDAALEYLQRTYGKPTHIERVAKQNAFGAQFQGIVANWTLPNGYSVDFEGIKDTVDEGEIKAVLPR